MRLKNSRTARRQAAGSLAGMAAEASKQERTSKGAPVLSTTTLWAKYVSPLLGRFVLTSFSVRSGLPVPMDRRSTARYGNYV